MIINKSAFTLMKVFQKTIEHIFGKGQQIAQPLEWFGKNMVCIDIRSPNKLKINYRII